jgi:hypothetical protein
MRSIIYAVGFAVAVMPLEKGLKPDGRDNGFMLARCAA